MSNIAFTQSPYRPSNYQASSFSRRNRVLASDHNLISRKKIGLKISFGPAGVMVTLFVLAMGASMLYLMHFNQVATKGYDLKRLEVDRQQLLDQHQFENIKLAEVKSMNSILHSTRLQRMVNLNKVDFVGGDTVLASANNGI